MYKTNFEGSLFFREILRKEFRLKEVVFEDSDYRVIFWKHPLYNKLISTPYRDRMALEYTIHPPKALNIEVIRKKFSPRHIIIKDIAVYMAGENILANVVSPYVNSDVALDDDLEKRFNHAAVKNIRKASNEYGLIFEVNNVPCFDKFYPLYMKTRKRLGVLPYPESFFKRIISKGLGEKVVFFSCALKGRTIGFLVGYLHEDEIISAHLAYDDEYKKMRISEFLFINAFLWGRSNGFRNYRFGADNKEQASLIKFKEKLGARTRTQFDYYGNCFPFNSESSRSMYMRKIFSSSPFALYRVLSKGIGFYFN